MTSCITPQSEQTLKREDSPQFSVARGKFVNTSPTTRTRPASMIAAAREFYFNKHPQTVPSQPVPVLPVDPASFDSDNRLKFVRLGHSSLLLQLEGRNWLLDPVFSQRASPVQWSGPKRFHQPPISIEALPEIEGVVLSHNHYDHLDYGSIQKLKERVNYFLVPLGLKKTLVQWGVAAEKVTEFDWWQQLTINKIEFTATPAQHFSGRGLFDSDQSLWSSWVIKTETAALFFSGDSGYFDGFKAIGERLGPFDYAFMECGAYNPLWAAVHMMPEQTVQAFQDVNGKVLVPVHNGTFDLSTHAWYDPLERVYALARERNITLLTPVMGQIIRQGEEPEQTLWWRPLMAAQPAPGLAGEH